MSWIFIIFFAGKIDLDEIYGPFGNISNSAASCHAEYQLWLRVKHINQSLKAGIFYFELFEMSLV